MILVFIVFMVLQIGARTAVERDLYYQIISNCKNKQKQ